jgi:hypothetical protein
LVRRQDCARMVGRTERRRIRKQTRSDNRRPLCIEQIGSSGSPLESKRKHDPHRSRRLCCTRQGHCRRRVRCGAAPGRSIRNRYPAEWRCYNRRRRRAYRPRCCYRQVCLRCQSRQSRLAIRGRRCLPRCPLRSRYHPLGHARCDRSCRHSLRAVTDPPRRATLDARAESHSGVPCTVSSKMQARPRHSAVHQKGAKGAARSAQVVPWSGARRAPTPVEPKA